MHLLACLSLGLVGCLLVGLFTGGAQAAGCPPNWLRHDKHCYGYFPKELSHYDAARQCKSHGGSLAIIVHNKEPREIAGFLKKLGANKDVWIRVDLQRKTPDMTSVLTKSAGFSRWKQVDTQKLPYLCETKEVTK